MVECIHTDNDSAEWWNLDIAVLAFEQTTAWSHFRVRVSVFLVANPLELLCTEYVNFGAIVARLLFFAFAVNLHNLLGVCEVY